jgi:oligosaccharide repeat unit polymerase
MNYYEEADIVYYFIHVVGIFFILLGFIIGDKIFPVKSKTLKNWSSLPFLIEKGFIYNKAIYLLAFISCFVCIVYYTAIGYNVFLLGAASIISGAGPLEDASALRLASYNSAVTGDYFFPGYVNQFKNTLLPLSLFYLCGVFSIEPKVRYKILTKTILIILSILSIVFILGTGQRGAFILAMLNGGVFIITIVSRKYRIRISLLGSMILFFFFTINSVINGRTQSNELSFLEGLEQLWSRITAENQVSAFIGFRGIIYPSKTQWGSEWMDQLLGILPSYSGSTLSNDIAQLIWGGLGTAPESSWGSIYYNFSWIGVIIVPFIFSLTTKYFYYRFYLKKKYLFRILIYVWSFFQIGSWVVGGPIQYYFDGGLVAVIILKLLIKLSENIFGKKYFVYYKTN